MKMSQPSCHQDLNVGAEAPVLCSLWQRGGECEWECAMGGWGLDRAGRYWTEIERLVFSVREGEDAPEEENCSVQIQTYEILL